MELSPPPTSSGCESVPSSVSPVSTLSLDGFLVGGVLSPLSPVSVPSSVTGASVGSVSSASAASGSIVGTAVAVVFPSEP